MSGELWQGFGAGALTSAFGAEYRKEELRNDVNSDLPDPTRIDIVAQYGDEFGGEVEATEAFVEFELPLLANKQGARLWSIISKRTAAICPGACRSPAPATNSTACPKTSMPCWPGLPR